MPRFFTNFPRIESVAERQDRFFYEDSARFLTLDFGSAEARTAMATDELGTRIYVEGIDTLAYAYSAASDRGYYISIPNDVRTWAQQVARNELTTNFNGELEMSNEHRYLIDNHSRLFNTMGESDSHPHLHISRRFGEDPYMYRYMIANCGLRKAIHEQDLRAERALMWEAEREQRLDSMRLRIKNQLTVRRDIRGRWMYGWSPYEAKINKEYGLHLRLLMQQLNQWGKGKNPGAPLSLLAEFNDIRLSRYQFENLHRKLNSEALLAYERYVRVHDGINFSSGFIRPVWWGNTSLTDNSRVQSQTLCRVSDEDPMQVCYIQTISKLMHGDEPLWTRTKPGRFLKRFYPDLSDTQVKELAERHEAKHKPVEVKYIENTDPDGWVDVYESADGFTSCMQYNRPSDRYLDEDLHGDDHPVRAYAYPGNGLRLAYVGDLSKGKVYARAIVREEGGIKGYIRVYGDDRLREALKREGYGERVSMSGVKIHRTVWREDDDYLVVPYIDSVGYANDGGDHLLICNGGSIDVQNSTGLARRRERYCCPHCGAYHDDEDDISYSDYEEASYCSNCEDRFVRAVVSYNRRYGPDYDMVYRSRTIAIGDDYYLDDGDLLESYGFARCEQCGEWEQRSDMFETSYGLVCDCTDVVRLDTLDDHGNEWARMYDAIEVIHLESMYRVWVHEDTDFYDDDDDESEGLSHCERYAIIDSPAHLAAIAAKVAQEAADNPAVSQETQAA